MALDTPSIVTRDIICESSLGNNGRIRLRDVTKQTPVLRFSSSQIEKYVVGTKFSCKVEDNGKNIYLVVADTLKPTGQFKLVATVSSQTFFDEILNNHEKLLKYDSNRPLMKIEAYKIAMTKGWQVSSELVDESIKNMQKTLHKQVYGETVYEIIRDKYTIPNDFEFEDEELFYDLIRCYKSKAWVLLLGPTGCGKSFLAKIIARELGLQFEAFNFGESANPAAKLIGDTKFNNEQGTFFKKSRFVNAIMNGSYILMDELTRDRTGDLANILMPVLDHQRYIALDESEDSPIVEVHEDTFFYGTANVGREYLGAATDLDRAWKDRFTGGIFEIDYLSEEKEAVLIKKRFSKCPDADVAKICTFANKVRKIFKDGDKINNTVSTRMTLSIAHYVQDGKPLRKAMERVTFPFFPIISGDDGERQQIVGVMDSLGKSVNGRK